MVNMAYAEDLIKLRKRIIDAVSSNVLDPKLRDFYEATLIQIMNEAERQRQVCVSQAEQLRKQASVLDGQASGYGAQSSIVYNVLNAYILQAEKSLREEQEQAAEKADKEIYNDSIKEDGAATSDLLESKTKLKKK